jgi:16S rRNA (cytosine967-C5)-methyltransferase
MGDVGEIWAVDRSAGRLKRVAGNAARLGLGSIQALAADAALLSKERPEWCEAFQSILIDAPCSGLGTLARHPDARWRMTPKAIQELLPQQQALLDSLVPLLAPGGRLVYATCTMHPAENGEQMANLLSRYSELRLKSEQQRWPDAEEGGDGFFAAVLQRSQRRS